MYIYICIGTDVHNKLSMSVQICLAFPSPHLLPDRGYLENMSEYLLSSFIVAKDV